MGAGQGPVGGVTKDTHLVAHMVASWGQGRAQWEGSPRILTWLPIWWHHGGRVGPSGRGHQGYSPGCPYGGIMGAG